MLWSIIIIACTPPVLAYGTDTLSKKADTTQKKSSTVEKRSITPPTGTIGFGFDANNILQLNFLSLAYGINSRYWAGANSVLTGEINAYRNQGTLIEQSTGNPIASQINSGFSLRLGYEYHFRTRTGISPFVEGFVRYAQESQEYQDYIIPPPGLRNRRRPEFNVGIGFGVEWCFHRHISVMAEQVLYVGYTEDIRTDLISGVADRWSGYRFINGTSQTRLRVNLYF